MICTIHSSAAVSLAAHWALRVRFGRRCELHLDVVVVLASCVAAAGPVATCVGCAGFAAFSVAIDYFMMGTTFS